MKYKYENKISIIFRQFFLIVFFCYNCNFNESNEKNDFGGVNAFWKDNKELSKFIIRDVFNNISTQSNSHVSSSLENKTENMYENLLYKVYSDMDAKKNKLGMTREEFKRDCCNNELIMRLQEYYYENINELFASIGEVSKFDVNSEPNSLQLIEFATSIFFSKDRASALKNQFKGNFDDEMRVNILNRKKEEWTAKELVSQFYEDKLIDAKNNIALKFVSYGDKINNVENRENYYNSLPKGIELKRYIDVRDINGFKNMVKDILDSLNEKENELRKIDIEENKTKLSSMKESYDKLKEDFRILKIDLKSLQDSLAFFKDMSRDDREVFESMLKFYKNNSQDKPQDGAIKKDDSNLLKSGMQDMNEKISKLEKENKQNKYILYTVSAGVFIYGLYKMLFSSKEEN